MNALHANAGFVPELEQQLLGALLAGGDHRAVLAMIEEQHFVEPIHQRLFALVRLAHERYSSTRLPVVAKLIEPKLAGEFKSAAGIDLTAYMARCLTSTTYSTGTAAQAARNVKTQWARLQLARETALASEAARSVDADPQDLIRTIGSTMDAVLAEVRTGSRGKTRACFSEAAQEAIAASRAARASGGLTGITSGLADLDGLIGGFQRRDLTLIGARPSMGKTTFGTSVAASAAMAGSGVGIFSLEMDRAKLVTRMCSDLAYRRGFRIAYQDVINGAAGGADLDRIEQIMADHFDILPLWIEDQPGLTIAEIRVKTEAMMAEAAQAGFPLEMLVVDHLLKVRSSSRYAGNRTYEIGEITEGLKDIAREYDLAVLLLTQLNRDVEKRDDKRPSLADLRDSGAIEQDADCVMFLYRDAYYLQREKPASLNRQMERDADLSACINKAELDIAKQRNGRVQSIELFADMPYSVMGNMARAGYAEMKERL